jgi:hypothetical protein
MFLKQSTAATIVLGPFLNDTDGKTAETGLTIAQADVRLSKNAGAFAQKGDASSCTHMENGFYSCPMNTTDTGTLGKLDVAVSKSGALPVFLTFEIVPAMVYDSLISGSDKLDVSVVEWLGTAPNALQSGRVDSYTGAMAANVITASAINAAAITLAKFGAGAIDATVLADACLTAAKLATGAITNAKFAAGAIDAASIASNAIAAAKIANDAITAAKIADGAIDKATLAADLKTGDYINAQVKGQDNIDLGALQKASVNAEVDTALADIDLNKMSKVGTAPAPATDSYLDKIMNKNVSKTFDKSTDSLEAIADAEASGLSAQQVRDAMKLAPSGGAPAAGSVDIHLDDLLNNLATIDAVVDTIQSQTDRMIFEEGGGINANVIGFDGVTIGDAVLNANLVSINSENAPINNLQDDYDGTGYNKVGKFEDGIVHVDTSSGFSGTSFPNGTAKKPVDNGDDAITIALANKLFRIMIRAKKGCYYFASVSALSFEGYSNYINKDNVNTPLLGIPGNTEYCMFKNLAIAHGGTGNIKNSIFQFCDFLMEDVIQNIYNCLFENCHFTGSTTHVDLSFLSDSKNRCIFRNSYFEELKIMCTYGGNVLDGKVFFDNCTGRLKITDLVDESVSTIDVNGFKGKIIIDSSCVGGTVTIRGLDGELEDNSAGTTVTLKDVPGSKTYRTGTNNSDGDIQQDETTGDFNTAQLLNFDGLATIGADVIELQASISSVISNTVEIKDQLDTIDDQLDEVQERTDRLPDAPADEETVAERLSEAVFKDSYNKEVLARSGPEPIQYAIGTGGNTETINVDYETIGSVKKVKKETVAGS